LADTKLYGGDVTIGFDGRKHMYTWKEKGYAVPGVTSILQRMAKPMLIPWAAGMASGYWRDKLAERAAKNGVIPLLESELEPLHKEAKGHHQRFTREAADIGKRVHAYAELRLRSTMRGYKGPEPRFPDTKDERILNGCNAFEEWLNSHHVELIEPERVIFSLEHFYAGTCDVHAYIDDEEAIGDFKTSSGVYIDHLFQTSAYQIAVEEELNRRIPARWLIRLDKKTGEFHAERHARNDLHSQAFLALRELHGLICKIEDKQ
jgi:hypothetical protein